MFYSTTILSAPIFLPKINEIHCYILFGSDAQESC